MVLLFPPFFFPNQVHNFGINLSPFDEQSETIVTTMPELNIARTGVLDYWADLHIDPDYQIMNFNESLRSVLSEHSANLSTLHSSFVVGFGVSGMQC